MSRLFLLAAVALTLVTFAAWLTPPVKDPPFVTPSEAFDPALAQLDTIDKLVAKARQQAQSSHPKDLTYQLEQLVRLRFYHGYWRYGFHENWAAWALARVLHPDLDAAVDPREIIKHPAAACSQQAIVVQAALARIGVTYATVEVPKHMLTAAWVDGQWHMVDPWGPNPRDRSRLHPIEVLMTAAGRQALFSDPATRQKWDTLMFNVPKVVGVNQFPAPNQHILITITAFVSNWLWLVCLAIGLGLSRLASGSEARSVRKPTHSETHS